MSFGISAAAGAALLGSAATAGAAYLGSKKQAKAAQAASATEAAAAQAGIDETARQFDTFIELLSPFQQAGVAGVERQQVLTGLKGPEALESAISGIEGGPLFKALTQQSENAILANASATGGLRGGDVQGALAEYRPQLLDSLLQREFGNVSQIAALGANAAAAQGQGALATGGQTADLLTRQGAATAGGQIAVGNSNPLGTAIATGLGTYKGLSPTSGTDIEAALRALLAKGGKI